MQRKIMAVRGGNEAVARGLVIVWFGVSRVEAVDQGSMAVEA